MKVKIKQWSMRVEAARSLDLAVLALCMALAIVVSVFHEPWRDEAQAWLLARDLGPWQLVASRLRYEGHTPLWYLLLMIPAKLGVPYEWGLKAVSLCVTAIAMFLLVRKSPFPWFVRYSLPFTYFLFYQYTVVSRSYCLIVLLMWLAALCFSRRNEKPWPYAAVLMALGAVSAHGILFGAGFALAWLLEIAAGEVRRGRGWLPRLLRDRRIHALLAYGGVLLCFAAMLWPPPDRYTNGLAKDYGGLLWVYMLLLAPLDGFISDVGIRFTLGGSWTVGVAPAILWVAALVVMFYYFRRKGLLWYGLLSYWPVTLFMAFVYFTIYHVGLYVVWLICLVWMCRTGPRAGVPFAAALPGGLSRVWRFAAPVVYAAVLAVQLFWTVSICANDIRLPFESGRAVAQYIRQHNLEGRRVMEQYDFNKQFGQVYTDQVVSVQPYFERNIFYNFNGGDPERSYNTFTMPTGQEPEQWRAGGPPEFYLENFLHSIDDYPYILNGDDYVQIASFPYYRMWKTVAVPYTDVLYARRDIAGEYLTPQN